MNKFKLLLLIIILIYGQCVFSQQTSTTAKVIHDNAGATWYKGNTHTHTTVSDGNAPPEYVVNWYHEQGYNFLVLTDHNKFVNPDSVKLPVNLREDFILIPGEEVTGKRAIHTTALNINGFVPPGNEFSSKTEVIQNHVNSIISQSGIPVLNHPNFGSGAQVSDILPVEGLKLIELYNGYPWSYNWGKEGEHISVETKWDSLLLNGFEIYAVASDDAHHYDQFYPDKINPGRGWVMVKSSTLCADSIATAMDRGDFYASNGVILKKVDVTDETYTVVIDIQATKEQMKSPYLSGEIATEGEPGFSIDFIGQGGKILQHTELEDAVSVVNGLTVISADGNSGEKTFATYYFAPQDKYVRCRVTFCRKRKRYEEVYEKLYAWTQPIFTGKMK
jgi:hypothetical protein